MKALNRGILAVALSLSVVPLLQGCFGVVAVGAGAGALMVADRRSSGAYIEDEVIERKAHSRIYDDFGSKTNVSITSFNRNVLLTGEAPNAQVKAELDRIVGGVPNVRAVTNEVQVAGASSLASRGNDAYITAKVKGRFVDANKFAANHVKVVTEAGTVYLLGLVTRKEADDASEIARTTSDVQKVVRVFEYIDQDQARTLDTRPPESTAPATARKP